jgi:hypothetical protein
MRRFIVGGREEAHPALGNFFVLPVASACGIDLEHDVDVVPHDGVGAERDGKELRQLVQAPFDPVAARSYGRSSESSPQRNAAERSAKRSNGSDVCRDRQVLSGIADCDTLPLGRNRTVGISLRTTSVDSTMVGVQGQHGRSGPTRTDFPDDRFVFAAHGNGLRVLDERFGKASKRAIDAHRVARMIEQDPGYGPGDASDSGGMSWRYHWARYRTLAQEVANASNVQVAAPSEAGSTQTELRKGKYETDCPQAFAVRIGGTWRNSEPERP